jgi:hypothetical protein
MDSSRIGTCRGGGRYALAAEPCLPAQPEVTTASALARRRTPSHLTAGIVRDDGPKTHRSNFRVSPSRRHAA